MINMIIMASSLQIEVYLPSASTYAIQFVAVKFLRTFYDNLKSKCKPEISKCDAVKPQRQNAARDSGIISIGWCQRSVRIPTVIHVG